MDQYVVQPLSEKLTFAVNRNKYRNPNIETGQVQRVRNPRTSNPKLDVSIKLLISKISEFCRRGGKNIRRARTDRRNRGNKSFQQQQE